MSAGRASRATTAVDQHLGFDVEQSVGSTKQANRQTKGTTLLKRLLTALAITIGLMAPAAVVAAPAQAAARTCVTDHMFRYKNLEGDYRTTGHYKFSGLAGQPDARRSDATVRGVMDAQPQRLRGAVRR